MKNTMKALSAIGFMLALCCSASHATVAVPSGSKLVQIGVSEEQVIKEYGYPVENFIDVNAQDMWLVYSAQNGKYLILEFGPGRKLNRFCLIPRNRQPVKKQEPRQGIGTKPGFRLIS